MKLRRLHIDGFGVYRDRVFELDPGAPAVLFYGPNEAGKSTLMGFIRAMLFGFPTRASRMDRYEPLAGGRYGGALELLDARGMSVRVERRDSNSSLRVAFEDGAVGGHEALQAMLGGLTGDAYRRLFAFGLGELQQLETLQREEISRFLYSAGMGIGGNAIVQAERRLAAQMDDLFKPRGSRQRVNMLLQQLEEAERQAREAGARLGSSGYNEMKRSMDELDRAIYGQEQQLEEERGKRGRLSKWRNCRPARLRLLELEAELARAPHWPDFPEQAVGRYEALAAELRAAAGQLRDALRSREARQARLADVRADETLLANKPELERLMDGAAVYTGALRRETELSAELKAERERLDNLLRHIDPLWTETELERFPLSVGQRERIRQFAAQLAELDADRQSLLAEGSRLERQWQEERLLEQERRQQTEALERELRRRLSVYGRGELPANGGASRDNSAAWLEQELRTCWTELCRIADGLLHTAERLDDVRRQADELEEPLAPAAPRRRSAAGRTYRRPRAAQFAAYGGFVLAAAAALWLWLARSSPYEAAALFVLLSALSTLLLRRQVAAPAAPAATARLLSALRRRADELEQRRSGERDQWRACCGRLAALWPDSPAAALAEAATAEAATVEAAAAGATTVAAEPNVISRLAPLIAAALADLRRLAELESEWRLARRRQLGDDDAAVRREGEERALREQRRTLDERADALAEAWREWQSEHGLPPHMTPQGVADMFHYAEQALRVLEHIRKYESRLVLERDEQQRFERAAVALLNRLGAREHQPRSGDELLYELRRRREQVEEHLRLAQTERELREQLAELEQAEQTAQEESGLISRRIAALLREAGAADEEELRQRAAACERRSKLEHDKRQLQLALAEWATAGDLAGLEREFSDLDPEQLDQLDRRLDEQIAQTERGLNESREKRGRLSAELDQLTGAEGEQPGELLQRCEEQAAAAGQAAAEWAQLALCAALIRSARQTYERERQPGVLRAASRYVAAMTQDRYVKVTARIGEKAIYAEKPSGESVDSSLLSRGTAEQLYLAMRFALADEYAKTAAPPLMMDDIFVNFDARRLEATIRLLPELAHRRQLLMFTCHAHVAQALRSGLPGMQLIELQA